MVVMNQNIEHDRIVFVHVPKTSGTAMYAYLTACSPFGVQQLERFDADPSSVDISHADWVGGHMSPHRFSKYLDRDTRRNSWFSMVRDPHQRMISEVNYSLDIIARGPSEFAGFNKRGVDVIMHVAETDFTNPFSVVRLLLKISPELSNTLGRYLLFGIPQPPGYHPSDDEIRDSLRRYTYIGRQENRDTLITALDFHAPPGDPKRKLNVSAYHFDPQIFDDPIVKPYVDLMLEEDHRIYGHILDIFAAPPAQTNARPSYPVATDENYSEDGYLAANPDVREAVAAGTFKSARQHFERHGLVEERRILTAAQPGNGWRETHWFVPHPPRV